MESTSRLQTAPGLGCQRRPTRFSIVSLGRKTRYSLISANPFFPPAGSDFFFEPELCGGLAISTVLVPLRGRRVVPPTPERSRWGVPRDPKEAKPSSCCQERPFLLVSERTSSCVAPSTILLPRSSPEHSAVMLSQRKRGRHMDIPPPTVIRDFRSHLDQTLDEPFP